MTSTISDMMKTYPAEINTDRELRRQHHPRSAAGVRSSLQVLRGGVREARRDA